MSARGGAAESSRDEDAPPETFAYTTTPIETKPLRAVLEIGAVLTLGFTWYATTAPTVHRWDVGYRWSTFRSKITFQDWGPDANSFGTNFIGHPLGGTGYYLAARSNHLSILQSFAMSAAGSLLWELLGEVSEVVSVNDMLVTPLSGLAIGEATTQLGALLDRCDRSTGHRVFGAVFGPFKTMNDAFDSLEPARATSGCSPNDWHRFGGEVGLSIAQQDHAKTKVGKWWPEGRFALSSHLVRLPGYESSGHDLRWFDDGNASSLALGGSIGTRGLTDLAFTSEVVLAGGYYRARRLDRSGGAWGSNGLVGVTSGFQYMLHQYRRGEGRAIDRLATIQPLGVRFEQRGALGGSRLNTALTFGPDFGGATPNAIDAYGGDPHTLPVVQVARGYYFGVGGHLGATVELADGPLSLQGDLAAEGLHDVRGPKDPQGDSLDDWFARYGGAFTYRAPAGVAGPRIFVERRLRIGRVGTAFSHTAETSFGAGMGVTF